MTTVLFIFQCITEGVINVKHDYIGKDERAASVVFQYGVILRYEFINHCAQLTARWCHYT